MGVLCAAIEDGKAGPKAEAKERAKFLREKFEWDENAARKIWCWGPETEGANVVVDQTTAIAYLNEIKEHVRHPFQPHGRDTTYRCNPPRSRADHATNAQV